jgi:hypothetical protein
MPPVAPLTTAMSLLLLSVMVAPQPSTRAYIRV